MKKIIALTDYKGFFGSKYNSTPYRSGMDKTLLSKFFEQKHYQLQFVKLSEAGDLSVLDDAAVIYTSSEDVGLHYKNYIEDIIFALSLRGANVIPTFPYLKANNNKVLMELLRAGIPEQKIVGLSSWCYGSLEELQLNIKNFTFPVVLKKSSGSMGKGVFLAKTADELIKVAKKISFTPHIKEDIRDFFRSIKHKGYSKESRYRNKFIVQKFIPNLQNDWKVYVFGEKYFVFYRPIFKHRIFKASGGGYKNYFYGNNAKIPNGLLDYAKSLFSLFSVPNASFDIAFDKKDFYLIEYQFVYFGTAGILYSDEYFIQENGEWVAIPNTLSQEECYVDSIVSFLEKK